MMSFFFPVEPSDLDSERNKEIDVKIQIGEITLKAHRSVLASGFHYFDSLFQKDVKRRYTIDAPVVLSHLHLNSFRFLLDALYSGQEVKINLGNVYILLRMAVLLRVPSLQEACVHFLQYNILQLEESISDFYSFACAYNVTDLQKLLCQYSVENLNRLSQEDVLVGVSYRSLCEILERYRSDFIIFRDEDRVLDLVTRWVLHSRRFRKGFFEQFLKNINFDRISWDYIKFYRHYIQAVDINAISQSEWTSKQAFKEYLLNRVSRKVGRRVVAMEDSGLVQDEDQIFLPYKEPTQSTLYLFVKYKASSKMSIFSANKYRPDWSVPCPSTTEYLVPNHVYNMRAAPLRSDNIFAELYCMEVPTALSARQLFSAYPSVDLQNSSKSMRLLKSPPLLLPSFDMRATWDSIYFYDTRTRETDIMLERDPVLSWTGDSAWTVEEMDRGIYRYDCRRDQWFPVPRPNEKLYASCMAIDDYNAVYLIGGERLGVVSDYEGYAQMLDSRASRWYDISKTQNLYVSAKCCTLGERIYVIAKDASLMEAYDRVAQKWYIIETTGCPAMDEVQQMVSFENMIWILGHRAVTYGEIVERVYQYEVGLYDPLSDRWCASSQLDLALYSKFSVNSAASFAKSPLKASSSAESSIFSFDNAGITKHCPPFQIENAFVFQSPKSECPFFDVPSSSSSSSCSSLSSPCHSPSSASTHLSSSSSSSSCSSPSSPSHSPSSASTHL